MSSSSSSSSSVLSKNEDVKFAAAIEDPVLYMIRKCRQRMNPRFNKVFAKFAKCFNLEYGRVLVDFVHLKLDEKKNKKLVGLQFASSAPEVFSQFTDFAVSVFVGNEKKGEKVVEEFSKFDILNVISFTNYGSCKHLGKFPDEMIEAFFSTSDGNQSIIRAGMNPTLKIPNQTINLSFTFDMEDYVQLTQKVEKKIIILNDIIHDRNQYDDNVRVLFHSSFDESTLRTLTPAFLERI